MQRKMCVFVFACKYFRYAYFQESIYYFIDFLFSVCCIHHVTDACLECVLEKGEEYLINQCCRQGRDTDTNHKDIMDLCQLTGDFLTVFS